MLTKEELVRSDDLGDYYRVRMDNRNMNYSKYLENGDILLMREDEYNSHNTRQLSEDEIVEKIRLLKIGG